MKGYIYIIKSNSTDDVYIGSTRLGIKRRFIIHKAYHKYTQKNNKGITAASKILCYDDAYIELLKELEDCSDEEMYNVEKEYIQSTYGVVNICYVLTDDEKKQKHLDKTNEWYEKNKERAKEAAKRWRENNKETAKENVKRWHESNKERMREIRRNWYNKQKMKKENEKMKSEDTIIQNYIIEK